MAEQISVVLAQLLLQSQHMCDEAQQQQWDNLFELEPERQANFARLESLVQGLSLAQLPEHYIESMQLLSQLNQTLLLLSQNRQQQVTALLGRLQQGSKATAAYAGF